MQKVNKNLILLLSSLCSVIVLSLIFLLSDYFEFQSLDGRFFYNYKVVFETYNKLGFAGLKRYTVFHILDYFYVISYFCVMFSLNLYVFPKKYKPLTYIIPLIPAMFDIIENTLIEIASYLYPTISTNLAKTISVFTSLKWGTGIIWFAIFLVFLIIKIVIKIKQQKENKYQNSVDN